MFVCVCAMGRARVWAVSWICSEVLYRIPCYFDYIYLFGANQSNEDGTHSMHVQWAHSPNRTHPTATTTEINMNKCLPFDSTKSHLIASLRQLTVLVHSQIVGWKVVTTNEVCSIQKMKKRTHVPIELTNESMNSIWSSKFIQQQRLLVIFHIFFLLRSRTSNQIVDFSVSTFPIGSNECKLGE